MPIRSQIAASSYGRDADPQSARLTRRDFLRTATIAAGTATIAGCGSTSPKLPQADPLAISFNGMLLDTDFKDPFAGGQILGYLPFHNDDDGDSPTPGTIYREGHDARRMIDLASLLMPGSRLTPSDDFYIRTDYPDKLSLPDHWRIKIGGEVKREQEVALEKLLPRVESRGSVLLECAGNDRGGSFGLLSVAEWSGIPFERIIEMAGPTSKAKSILVNGFDDDSRPSQRGHSKPTCSWIFTFDQLLKAEAVLATEMNGKPLPKPQGAPVRLVVPGWYGCSEAKWVNEIRFVDADRPATLQMMEFAGRTLQEREIVALSENAIPDAVRATLGLTRRTGGQEAPHVWARDFRPATIDQAAVPVRVECWKLDGKIVYRIVGITWGGPTRTNKLKIRLDRQRSGRFVPVQFCQASTTNREYGIWLHSWEPALPGPYLVRVRVDNAHVPSRKQSRGYYDRVVVVPKF